MKVTLLDTLTGKIAVAPNELYGSQIRSYEWAENGWSCDCNRQLYFGLDESPAGEGICNGSHRFLVISAKFIDPDDYHYTLRELNADYPEELIKAHIP